MVAISTVQTRISDAKQFFESVSEADPSRMYIAIGKTTPWPDDQNPPAPMNTLFNIRNTWEQMIGGKRINNNAISHVIRRVDWISGLVYTQYTDSSENFYSQPFYAITDEYNVYKCISNGNGNVSTVKPTGTGTSLITLADGYTWKYMYTLTTGEATTFMTNNWIPVKTLTEDDGSAQWLVQEAAVPGTINTIQVTSGGSGYTTAPTVNIIGDGAGASAVANLVAGAVDSVTITTTGNNYTRAIVTFEGGDPTTPATASPVISPVGGHGKDAVSELGGHYVMIMTDFVRDESEVISVNNDFRQISIIIDPALASDGTPADVGIFDQTHRLLIETGYTGTFAVDDTVTGAVSEATGRVVDFDPVSRVLKLTELVGEFDVGEGITTIGGDSGTISTITEPDFVPAQGEMIYIENNSPVNRSENQTEEIRIIREF